MVPAFRPGIGKQDEAAFDRAVRQRFDEAAGILCIDTDILDFRGLNGSDKSGYAIHEGLAADKSDLRVRLGLRSQMLTAAKPDFKPNGFDRLIEKRKRVFETFERFNRDLRQNFG